MLTGPNWVFQERLNSLCLLFSLDSYGPGSEDLRDEVETEILDKALLYDIPLIPFSYEQCGNSMNFFFSLTMGSDRKGAMIELSVVSDAKAAITLGGVTTDYVLPSVWHSAVLIAPSARIPDAVLKFHMLGLFEDFALRWKKQHR